MEGFEGTLKYPGQALLVKVCCGQVLKGLALPPKMADPHSHHCKD
jgi:hypothetical protein